MSKMFVLIDPFVALTKEISTAVNVKQTDTLAYC